MKMKEVIEQVKKQLRSVLLSDDWNQAIAYVQVALALLESAEVEQTAIAKQAESYSVSLPKEILPSGPIPEDPLVLASRKLMLCFPEEIPADQESLNFNIPAYIVEELRQALGKEKA